MTRTALVSIVSLAALAGCSSQPVYTAYDASAGNTTDEGAGDALGMALFGESVMLAKHPDLAGDTAYATAPTDDN